MPGTSLKNLTPPPPPVEELPAAARIVRAARAHFFTHGFRSVTMDQLADELGMSKKTLYAHFPSKSLLLEAVIAAKFEEMGSALERITADSAGDFLDSLHQLLACMHRHTEEIQPPFTRDMRREDPAVFQSIESRRREIIQRYFGKLFQNGRAAGIIRNLGWSAAACFVAAWFLPAASEVPGWMAFRFAFAPVWPYGSSGGEGSVEDAVPQVLSALTNVVFVVMFAQFVAGKIHRPGLWFRVAIACFVLDLYWLVQMLRDGAARDLLIGYYVWLAAFALLVVIGWLLMRAARSVTPH